MKAKNKVILGSVLAIAMSASMIAGTTFALFTSESSVNIAVTSAQVGIKAEIVEGESKSTLGGKALGGFNTENGLALENIAPGDVFSFTVKAENSSSISIQYRTTIEFTNPLLASALDVTIGDLELSGITKYATAWQTIEQPKGAIEDLEVEIAFPALEESQNQFQNLSTDIKVVVEGVQGNATTSNAGELVFNVSRGEQLEKAVGTVKDLKQDATINLVNDVVLSHELYIKQHPAKLTINGNGHEITASQEYTNVSGKYQLVKIDSVAELVTLNDITLKHVAINEQKDNYHTLDVWKSKVELNNVTLVRDFESVKGGAALVINGAEVTATDLHIVVGGSAWGGINVDSKNGSATLTLKSGFGASVGNAATVWCENGGTVVDEEDALVYVGQIGKQEHYALPAVKVGNTKYNTIEDALQAINDSTGSGTITLCKDIEVDQMIYIAHGENGDGYEHYPNIQSLVLDGNGHTISASENFHTWGNVGQYSLLKVEGLSNVTIKNITLKHSALKEAVYFGEKLMSYHTLDIHTSNNVVLENVTLVRDFDFTNAGAPLVLNASSVTVKGELNLVTGGNAWYGANLDKVSTLTFAEGSKLVCNHAYAIRVESGELVNAESVGLKDMNYYGFWTL